MSRFTKNEFVLLGDGVYDVRFVSWENWDGQYPGIKYEFAVLKIKEDRKLSKLCSGFNISSKSANGIWVSAITGKTIEQLLDPDTDVDLLLKKCVGTDYKAMVGHKETEKGNFNTIEKVWRETAKKK